MNLSLRSKLVLIIGAAAASLAVVSTIGVQLAYRHDRNLQELEERWVPKLELEPRLQAKFERLGQSLKDAVAAQDRAALQGTRDIEQDMQRLIAQASGALDPGEAERLRLAISDYHQMALGVSTRLIDGEAGEDLVETMAEMQAKHQNTVRLIDRVARLDRGVLESGFRDVRESSKRASRDGLSVALVCLVLAGALSFRFAQGAFRSLEQIALGFARFAKGSFDQLITPESDDEIGRLANEANQMALALQRLSQERDAADWVRAGQVALAEKLRDDLEVGYAARIVVEFLFRRLHAERVLLYLSDDDGTFRVETSYSPDVGHSSGANGHGAPPAPALIVKVAQQSKLLVAAPPFGEAEASALAGVSPLPAALVLLPLSRGTRTLGVLELHLGEPCSASVSEFLALIRESLAAAFESAKARSRQRDLLSQSQAQAARLAVQEITLQDKANELAKVSSYKSQFLANMSHELRTPLNSMLLLSQILGDNEGGNLTGKQVEHCRTIHEAGKGLLALINQVLDLSKIEAGRQDLEISRVAIADVLSHLKSAFEPQFSSKGLGFTVEVSAAVPEEMDVDRMCLQRILINLLGNALKFTERGGVALRVDRPARDVLFRRADLQAAESIAFCVSDTGIGIAERACERIFARFEQADSRTARRYGGTGLGLAIAAESAVLMGGELQVSSLEGRGSTFTCFLPERARLGAPARNARSMEPGPASRVGQGSDDRDNVAPGEPHVLVVEDDLVFADQLVSIVHALGFKALVAQSGEEAVRLAVQTRPMGMLLDVGLPDMDGFAVHERMKQEPETQSVRVHFLSGSRRSTAPRALGSVGYLTKPATREALGRVIEALMTPAAGGGQVLIVEDDLEQSASLADLLDESQLRSRIAHTAAQAVTAIEEESFGCMILDLGLPDLDGLLLLEELSERTDIDLPPVVVHTGRALSVGEAQRIRGYARAVVPKGSRSMERVVEEVRVFIGELRDKLPRGPATVPPVARSEPTFDRTKILIADDDMRTVYALSALLRGKGAEVVVAETGRQALKVLEEHSDVRVVLMDIAMPEMDGYEALHHLRNDPRFASLPVIALTAKAMRGELERCRAAGASDYMTKPVDPGALLSRVQSWIAGAAS